MRKDKRNNELESTAESNAAHAVDSRMTDSGHVPNAFCVPDMTVDAFDFPVARKNTDQLIDFCSRTLGLPALQLAALVGVSWLQLAASPRLKRLAEVIDYASKEAELNGEEMNSEKLALLLSGRVKIFAPREHDDDEDGTAALISYICACPEEAGWRANVDAARIESHLAATGGLKGC